MPSPGRTTIRIQLLLAAIAFAVLVYYSDLGSLLASAIHSSGIFGAVFAGAFYTSGLTTPTAFLLLLEAMALGDYIAVAFAASLSAAIVDTALFMILKAQLERNAAELIRLIRAKFGRHDVIFSIIGFFLFGSPLPDEFALACMQISEIKPLRIAIIVFLAKFATLLLTYAAIYGI